MKNANAKKSTVKNESKKTTAKNDAKQMMTIVQIASELNMNAKVARAKLRRANARANEKFYDKTIAKWRAIERDSTAHVELVRILKSIKQ